MKARLKRTSIALVVVLVGYQLYSWIAIPLIEPSITFAERPALAPWGSQSARSFEGLFPPGSWELDNPKVLETDQGILLFDEYQPYSDGGNDSDKEIDSNGRIELDRCTLIFNSDSFEATPRRNRGAGKSASRPVVMRAESGATIYFDGPLSLMGGRFGRVVGGRLAGEIKIFSPPSSPGSSDDLEITTKGVQIDEQRIWTPHPVSFRYGRNRGSGRVLSIELQGKRKKNSPVENALAIGRIKSLELVHLDHLEVESVGNLFPPGADQPVRSEDLGVRPTARPVEIRCRGPFRFDFERNIAFLSEQVDIIRHNLAGPSDQLNCAQLELHFETVSRDPSRAVGSQATRNDQVASSSLQPKKIVAKGFPVIVRAPSSGASARAERMEYEFAPRRVWLKDRQQLVLRTATFHVVAPELEYEIPLQGQLGRLWAAGPGNLRGKAGENGVGLAVDWSQEVRMVPQGDIHVLSVQGATVAAADGAAKLSGDEVHLYLREQLDSAEPDASAIIVQRMQAAGQVHVDSARFSAAVSEAKVWFVQAPAQDARNGTDSPAGRPSMIVPAPAKKVAGSVAKFDLAGDVLHAQIALGETPRLTRLSVNGNVQLKERAAGSEAPTTLSGDRLELHDGDTGQLEAELIGQPANASARGSSLVAARISLSQGENHVRVSGPGTITVPQSSNTSPAAGLPPIRISWTGGMTFDGQLARFEQEVAAEGIYLSEKGQAYRPSVSSELLEVSLTRRVDFKNPKKDEDIGVREFRLPGRAFLESRQFDRRGTQQSHDQMQVRDLVVDQVSGRIHGVGPGWIVHRGRGSGTDKQPPLSLPTPGGLAFLRVDFEREMAGNLHLREIVFSDRTDSIYGPISSWNETLEKGQELREKDVLLTCQRLAVADMDSSGGSLESLEFQATGNASVVGQSFSGLGERISYSRKKDQLILTGDGRSDAYLKYQQRRGAKPVEVSVAQVLFYPSTKDVKLLGIQSFEAPDPTQFRNVRGSTRLPPSR